MIGKHTETNFNQLRKRIAEVWLQYQRITESYTINQFPKLNELKASTDIHLTNMVRELTSYPPHLIDRPFRGLPQEDQLDHMFKEYTSKLK